MVISRICTYCSFDDSTCVCYDFETVTDWAPDWAPGPSGSATPALDRTDCEHKRGNLTTTILNTVGIIDMPQRDDRFHMLGDVLRHSLKEFVHICLRQPNGAQNQNTHILLNCAVAKILSIGFTAPHSIRCTAKPKDGQKYISSTHHHTHNHGAVHD